MTNWLEGRTVLLTGGGRGIAAEAASRLASRGTNVVLVDIDAEAAGAIAERLGDRAQALVADVTDEPSMRRAVAQAVERFGAIDAVVANAGIEAFGAIERMDPAAVRRVIEVNLLGAWTTARVTLPELVKSRGYWLSVTSLSSVTHAPLNAAYDASKAGLVSFTKTLRMEVRARGVDVGIIYFGYVETEAGRAAVEDPQMRRVMARLPKATLRPTPVVVAADAVVRSIEHRRGRTVVPRSGSSALFFPELAQRLVESRIVVPEDLVGPPND